MTWSSLKPFAVGLCGALLMILLYQAFLDHHRLMKTCENVAAATGGKFQCW